MARLAVAGHRAVVELLAHLAAYDGHDLPPQAGIAVAGAGEPLSLRTDADALGGDTPAQRRLTPTAGSGQPCWL